MYMQRNIQGFLPPFVLTELARRNATETHYLETLLETQKIWVHGQSLFVPATGKGSRTVYDGKNKTSLPGTEVRREGGPAASDAVANQAFEFAGDIRDFYWQVYNRNSIDGNGMDLLATVHYGRLYDNAFWNGVQMVYGDGDKKIFKNFVLLDVVGHEMTHGVTETTSGLEYWGQSGALNEHVSDVFGVLLKQWKLKQTVDKADWLIGAGLLADGINGRALRDMLHPGTAYDDPKLGKDPQPDHMSKYVDTDSDNGGVHYNSGIPNRAFALFALDAGGNGWEKPGMIWYQARNRSPRDAQFTDFATKTVQAAQGLYPELVPKLIKAWDAVGVAASA